MFLELYNVNFFYNNVCMGGKNVCVTYVCVSNVQKNFCKYVFKNFTIIL